MSAVNRKTHNAYRLSVVELTDDELRKEIWLLDEHIKYLQREDDQRAHDVIELLHVAIDEKDRRAINKGYM
jgi:hypothetical protein